MTRHLDVKGYEVTTGIGPDLMAGARLIDTQLGLVLVYVSALAPAVAALAGVGVVTLWREARTAWAAFAVLGASVAGTGTAPASDAPPAAPSPSGALSNRSLSSTARSFSTRRCSSAAAEKC